MTKSFLIKLENFSGEFIEIDQSIDLQSKSMDWFLHDRDLHHNRINKIQTPM